jgi:hypothetical protein
MKEDRKTYRKLNDVKCCWNCRHAFSRFNLSLSCKNSEEWVKEAGVEPLGVYDGWEKREVKNAVGDTKEK